MTGCQFAARIARERHQILSVAFPELVDAADVDSVFETGQEAKLPAIAMFTGIRTEAALVEQLARMSAKANAGGSPRYCRTASRPTTCSSAWTGESAKISPHP